MAEPIFDPPEVNSGTTLYGIPLWVTEAIDDHEIWVVSKGRIVSRIINISTDSKDDD